MILDICFIYLNLCARKYLEKNEQDDNYLETISKGQLCIYNFLEYLLLKDENKKEAKKRSYI